MTNLAKDYKQTWRRFFLKIISWGMTEFAGVVFVLYLLTKQLWLSVEICFIIYLLRAILHWFHEAVWERI